MSLPYLAIRCNLGLALHFRHPNYSIRPKSEIFYSRLRKIVLPATYYSTMVIRSLLQQGPQEQRDLCAAGARWVVGENFYQSKPALYSTPREVVF